MSNLLVSPKWNSFINKVDAGEEISGGDLGNANIATRQLAENVMFLRDSMFTLVADATGDLSQAIVESNKKTKDEFDIVAGLIEAQNEIIIAEAKARKEAISASNTKIAEEAAARIQELGVQSVALQKEIDDRKEAFRLEHISRAESEAKFTEDLEEVLTEAEASVKKVENLSSQLIGGYDGSNLDFVTEGLLFQQKTVTSTAIKGMAEQISMLSAGVGEQFDTAEIWHFDKDKEDWINGVFDVGYLTVKSETVTSPTFLIDGDVYHHLKMRINKVGDPDWAGNLVWDTGSIALPEPVFVDDVTLVTLDTTWSGDITQLQLKLSTDADDTNYYKIDWITIGRPSPGASTASVLDLKIATATRDEALAQDIRGLSTKMDTDNALLSSNVNAKLETITTQQQTQATDITTLSSNVDTMNTKLSADIVLVNSTLVTKETALAESIAALTSKTNASEVSVLTQLQTLTDVDSALGTQLDALSASFDTAAAGIVAQNLVFTAEDLAQATQISQLTAKVDGNIAEVNTQIETLTDAQSANANKFTSISAEFKALDDKTDASDAEIRVNAADIIEERNARATDILAQATRIDVLTTEVGENAASATTRINLLSLEDKALAERLDVLTASTDDSKANINLRLTALAEEDSAFSEQLTQVMAAVDDNDSAVHERVTALTTATDAEAEKLTLLTATVGANTAEIETTSRTAATNSGAIAEFNTRLSVEYLPKVENIASNILNAVKQTDVQYYLSISETQPLGGEWLTLAPTWEPSKYMFQRMETTYVDGTVKYTPGVNGTNISGAKGDKGLDGKDGSDGVAGLQGPSGADGLKGPAGKDGLSSYTHLAYATSNSGIGFSTGYFETATYIGMYVDNIKEDSENYAVYNWSLIKGADGAKGIPGVKGSDGKTSYLHIAYANSPDGAEGFSTTASIGKTYIGQYTDFLENDSTNYTLYSWTLIKGEKGDQGPIGLTGLEGPKGDKGIQGPMGPMGPAGPEGLRGLTGLEGLQGDQGIRGEKGEDGLSSYTHLAYATSVTGANFNTGHFPAATYIGMYVDNEKTDSTVPSTYKWSLIKGADGANGIAGPKGTDGKTSYLHIAYANNVTGNIGFSTTVSEGKTHIGQYTDFELVDSSDYTKYSWTLIKGDKGDTGPAGLPGVPGIEGKAGANGIQGPKGADGTSSYTHLAYATSVTGTNFNTAWYPTATYIGMYVDRTEADSVVPSKYNWSLIKGADGANGIAGPKGADGKTTYLHIAYANSEAGDVGFSTTVSAGKAYIGQYTDTTLGDSEDYSIYNWSLIKGADGLSSYAHLAYATSATGTNFNTSHFQGATYIGMYVDNTEDDSTDYIKYNWSLIKGADGANGIPGPTGEDGKTSYLHVAYATSATGAVGFSTTVSAGKTYIGQYTDFELVDSPSYTKYKWSLIKGDKGDKGDQGIQGPIGLTGLEGPVGATGIKGDKGANGLNSYTHIAYATSASGLDFSTGHFVGATYIGMYVDNTETDSTVYTKYNWSLIKGADGDKGIAGPTGADGKTAYLHIAYATSATGNTGFSTTVSAGKTYIGQYTDNELVDSPTYTRYKWTLIKGEKGDQGIQGPIGLTGLTGLEGAKGDQGIQGPKGADGLNSYTHIAYATSVNGALFSTSWFEAATYIGMYVDNIATDSTVTSKYKWSLIKGADGANGIAGPKGTDGKTAYLHIAYATSANGSVGFSTTISDGKTYIGQYTDNELVDSPTYTKYKWSLIKGDKGDTGPQGPIGLTGVRGLEGPIGATGIQGPKGADGLNSYTHLAYATGPAGQGIQTAWFEAATYIGMYVDNIATDSTDATKYKWSLIKGADGANGIQGPTGADGKTAYLHIAYATSANGATGFSTTVSAGKTYIGQYTDNELVDSQTYTKYKWTLIKGETGATGPTGNTGATGPVGQGIDSVTEQYAVSTSKTVVPTTWTTVMPEWSYGLYVWSRSMIKLKNPVATEYTTPIVDSSWEAVNNINVGGRNLLRDSNVSVSNNLYSMKAYTLTESPNVGDDIVITIWGTLGADRTSFTAYNSGGSVQLGALKLVSPGIYRYVGKWVKGTASDTFLQMYQFANGKTSTSTINAIKLEKGNIGTEWSPAPEDTATAIQGSLDIGNAITNEFGILKAESKVLTEIGGKISGWKNLNNGNTSSFDILADNFSVGNSTVSKKPFIINGSDITFNGKVSFNSMTDTEVIDKAVSDINNLEIGGTNLISSNINNWEAGWYDPRTAIKTGTSNHFRLINDIIVEPNTTYIISGKERIVILEITSSDVFIKMSDMGVVPKTLTTTSTTNKFRIYVFSSNKYTNINEVYNAKFKIEKGNKATDWSPAPEDVQGEINQSLIAANTEAERLAGNALSSAKTYADDLDKVIKGTFKDGIIEQAEAAAIKTHIAQLTSEKEEIAQKYTTMYANSNLLGAFKTNLASANTAYNTAHSSLVSYINSSISNGKVTTAQSAAIATRFTTYQTALKTLSQRFEEAGASIIAQAESNSIAYTDSIEIGGRNLLLDSQKWVAQKGSDTILGMNNVGSLGIGSAQVFTNNQIYSHRLMVGETYTWSMLVASTGSITNVTLYTGNVFSYTKFTNIENINNSGFVKVWVTATVTADNVTSSRFHFAVTGTAGSLVYFANLKVEKGNKATDWTPAPEDTQNEIAQSLTDAKTYADGLDTAIKGAFKDGIIEQAEAAAIKTHIAQLTSEKEEITQKYTTMYANSNLLGTAKTNLASANTAYNTAHKSLVDYINLSISNGKVTTAQSAAIATRFTTYQTAIKTLSQRFEEAGASIVAKSETNANAYTDSIEIGGRNLIVLNSLTNNYLQVSGSLVADVAWRTTDYISAKPNSNYIMSGYTNLGTTVSTLFYNSSKAVISGIAGSNRSTVTSPAGTAYIRTSFATADINTIKFEKGHKATDWTPAPEDVDAAIIAVSTSVTDITSDGKVTPNEKRDLLRVKDEIVSTHTELLKSVVTVPGATTPATYTTAYSNVTTRLTNAAATPTATTNISTTDRNNLTAALSVYFTERAKLNDLLVTKSKEYTESQASTATDNAINDAKTKDTRSVNSTPADYQRDHPRKTVKEFKTKSVIGLTEGTGTYCYLETQVKYSDASGGRIIQTAYTDDSRIFTRNGAGTVWTAWVESETAAGAQAKANESLASAKLYADGLDTVVKGAFKDGIIEQAEAKAIRTHIAQLTSEKEEITQKYTTIYANTNLSGAFKTNLASANTAYNTAHSSLVSYINSSIANGAVTAAQSAAIDTRFTTYQGALKLLSQRFEEATSSIIAQAETASKLYTDSIEVGGRNIIKNSALVQFKGSDSGNGNASVIIDDYVALTPVANGNIYGSSSSNGGLVVASDMVAGEKYTYSVYVRSLDTTLGMYCYTGGNHIVSSVQLKPGNVWERISFTFTQATNRAKGTTFLAGFHQLITGKRVDYRNIKLERGSKATDWSPAPEDTQDEISKSLSDAKTYADGLDTVIKGTFKDGIIEQAEAAAIKTHIAQLTSEQNEIAQKYTTMYANSNLLGTAKTNLASANTAYNTAHSSLVSYITSSISNGAVTSAQSAAIATRFTTYQNAIKLLSQRFEEAGASIIAQTEANAITYTDSIEIGGRNLITPDITYTNGSYYHHTTGAITTSSTYVRSSYFAATPGKYVFSLDPQFGKLAGARIAAYDASMVFISGGYIASGDLKFVAPPLTAFFGITSVRGANLHLKWKLETGDKATGWSPSPEDVDASINNVKTSVTDITSDGKVTPNEKRDLLRVKDEIVSTHTELLKSVVTVPGATTPSTYTTAYSNVTTRLTNAAASPTTTTDIAAADRTNLTNALSVYFTERAKLNDLLVTKSKAYTESQASTSLASAKLYADGLDTVIKGTFKDGIIEQAEAKAIRTHIAQLTSEKDEISQKYTTIYANTNLTGTPKTNLASANTAYNTAHTSLVSYITSSISNGAVTAAQSAVIDTRFTAYQTALKTLATRFEEATSSIIDKAESNATTAANNYADLNDKIIVIDSKTKKFLNPSSYSSASSAHTGYLIIETPIQSARMVTIDITGYNHQANKASIALSVSFYISGTTFSNFDYVDTGTYPIENVRLGLKGGTVVIIVGNATSTWAYPKIDVTQAIIGYTASPDTYKDGWVTRIANTITDITNIRDMSNVYSTSLKGIQNNVYYPATTEIHGGNIRTKTIAADSIVANSITAGQIAANTITATQMTTDSITARELKAGTVAATHIVGNTITGDKLVTDSITARELKAGTVAATHIAANTITGDKLVVDAINTREIKANAVTATQINVANLSAVSADMGNITGGSIKIGSISGSLDNSGNTSDISQGTMFKVDSAGGFRLISRDATGGIELSSYSRALTVWSGNTIRVKAGKL